MLIPTPDETFAQPIIASMVEWLRLIVETAGAIVIASGLIAAARTTVSSARRHALDFVATRLVLARYLALALELQLGADILSTAVAPTWERIGKLGAIAIIRTFLNYFLQREIRAEGSLEGVEHARPKEPS